jgi:hypothetical protein
MSALFYKALRVFDLRVASSGPSLYGHCYHFLSRSEGGPFKGRAQMVCRRVQASFSWLPRIIVRGTSLFLTVSSARLVAPVALSSEAYARRSGSCTVTGIGRFSDR